MYREAIAARDCRIALIQFTLSSVTLEFEDMKEVGYYSDKCLVIWGIFSLTMVVVVL